MELEIADSSFVLMAIVKNKIVYLRFFKLEEEKNACKMQALLSKQYGEGEFHLMVKEEFVDILKEGIYSIETGQRRVT